MNVRDGLDVLVADGPAAFGQQVARLYGDEALWNSMSGAGVEYAARWHSRAVMRERLRELTEALGGEARANRDHSER
jgi:hypothetical protein